MCGDYLHTQALQAARILRDELGPSVGILPLDELTVLYRPDAAAREIRRTLRERAGDSRVMLLSSGYPDVLASLWAEAVGRPADVTRGYVSQPNCTAGSSLLAAGCTWMQLAGTAWDLMAEHGGGTRGSDHLRRYLRATEDRLRRELRGAWDDPHWFAALAAPSSTAATEGELVR